MRPNLQIIRYGMIVVIPANRQPVEQDQAFRPNATGMSSNATAEYTMQDYHPIATLVGRYSKDPLWDELEEIMKRNRDLDESDDSL